MISLSPNTPLVFTGTVVNETTFNEIKWEIDGGNFTTTNPHSELTYSSVKAEMDKL